MTSMSRSLQGTRFSRVLYKYNALETAQVRGTSKPTSANFRSTIYRLITTNTFYVLSFLWCFIFSVHTLYVHSAPSYSGPAFLVAFSRLRRQETNIHSAVLPTTEKERGGKGGRASHQSISLMFVMPSRSSTSSPAAVWKRHACLPPVRPLYIASFITIARYT